MLNSLASYLSSKTSPNNITIDSYSWYPETTLVGNLATVSIALSGGTAGIYTLEIMQDIPLAADDVIASYTIDYPGESLNQSFSFTSSSIGSYYTHLIYQCETIWSQPNDSSRLKVN